MNTNEIPLLFGSPKDKALFTAKEFIKTTKSAKVKVDLAVIFFSKEISMAVEKYYKIKIGLIDLENPHLNITRVGRKKVLFTKSVIGAPASGTMIEEIIACGAKKIILIGSAGTLQDNEIGSIVVPTKAIRDEGTSYHYIKPSKYSYPSKKLVKDLEAALKEKKILYAKGATWTTDSPYRETIRKIKKYKKEGAITVEMEASAAYAIAKVRKVQIASIFWISDQLGEKEWKPHFYTKAYTTGAQNVFLALKQYLEKETKAK